MLKGHEARTSRLHPSDQDIKTVKDEAGQYVLEIIWEITNELEWHLRAISDKFRRSLDTSDFTAETDAAQKAFLELYEFVQRTDLKHKIQEKEAELKEKEDGCLKQLSHYFQHSNQGSASFQNAKKAGA